MKKNITKKVVISDYGEAKKYECGVCDLKTNDEDEAIKHNQESKHPIWKKRMSYTVN